MKLQTPAQGINQTNEWPDAKTYVVSCECSDPEHQLNMWIEVEGDNELQSVQLSFYIDTWTPFWDHKFSRIKAAYNILFKGVMKQEHHIILNKQSAYNLSGTINKAIKELDHGDSKDSE
mgnify:CR=1 FL=1